MKKRRVSAGELAYYRAHGQEAVREDGVVCLECGALQGRLGAHVAAHGLTLGAYRAKWGYAPAARLVVPPLLRGVRRPATVSARALEHYRTRFREAAQEDYVVCLECGGAYRLLGSHLRVHRQRMAQYREKWGYTTKSFLMTPAVYMRKREMALARNFGAMAPSGALSKALHASRQRPRTGERRETTLVRSEVFRARLAAGWRPGKRPKRVPDATLRTLAAEALPIRDFAARAGLTRAHARARLRALGLVVPGMRPPRRRVPSEELLVLRRAGLWTREIAARTGLTRSAVKSRLRWLRRRGEAVPRPARPKPPPAPRVPAEAIVPLAQAGLSAPEIAARVGLSLSGLAKRLTALRRGGRIPPSPSARKREAQNETLRALVAEGLRLGEIARRVGLAYRAVWQRLRSLGLRPAIRPKVPDAELLSLRAGGLWDSQIAAQTGLSRTAVAQRLDRLRARGVPVPLPKGFRPHHRRQVNHDQLLTLARQGFGPAAIARRVGVPIAKVYDGIERLRLHALLPPGPLQPNRRVAEAALRACVQQGLTIREIAARVGRHPMSVAGRLRRLGLKARPARPPRRATSQRARRRLRAKAHGPRPTSASHPQRRRP